LAETLDSGSIPILPTSYYARKYLSGSPLIILESWEGINQVITSLIANATKMDQLQTEVMKWWQYYKSELQSQIARDVGFGDD
jgi:hypothetical protein